MVIWGEEFNIDTKIISELFSGFTDVKQTRPLRRKNFLQLCWSLLTAVFVI